MKSGEHEELSSEHNRNKRIDGDVKSGERCFQLRDAEYRGKFLHSVWIAIAFFTLGIWESQHGPAFLDLQIITKTDVEKASAFFTAHSCGYMTGSMISGLINKKVNPSLLIFVNLVAVGAQSIGIPYCSMYGLMVFMRYIGGVFGGAVAATGNAEHMRIWGNDGRALMQLLHFAYAMGGTVSPLFTEPFLAARDAEDTVDGTLFNNTALSKQLNETNMYLTGTFPLPNYNNMSFQNTNLTESSTNVTSTVMKNQVTTTNVRFAFLITGVIVIIGSLPFLSMFLKNTSRPDRVNLSIGQRSRHRKLPKVLHVVVISVVCAFFLSETCVENSFPAFLMTFVVREFSFVTKSRGAYITAVYWASFAASRFLMIFVSRFLSSVNLIAICGISMLLSFTGFAVSSANGEVAVLTVFVGMAGLSMSAVFPACLSWCESELTRVTPRVASAILVSASTGPMLNSLLIAFLMEEMTNMWFCYLLLIEAGVMYIFFIFVLLFNRRYVNIRYGLLNVNEQKIVHAGHVPDTEQGFMVEETNNIL